ncbi:MAG: extracellular solute-binding protein [Lachnospiraceae bacterium]|nr:extracellular solute-binding protein [Lachnospiraceae bacterium]
MKSLQYFIFLLIISVAITGCAKNKERSHINIAIPYSDNVQDYETNYYIKWLEEKTGIDIDVTIIRSTRSNEYLNNLRSSDLDVDAVFFGGDFQADEKAVSDFVSNPDAYDEAALIYTCKGLYKSSGCGQVMWINKDWLTKLNLDVPKNTDELYRVLLAFEKSDPNGNGINDELPLVGSVDEYEFNSCLYILNSFIYTDPYNSYCYMDNDKVFTACVDNSFREGLSFCNKLYNEKLIEYADVDKSQLCELVNSPNNLVGAFTTDSIADVIYQENPEIMAKYIHLPPLTGPDGKSFALYREYEPAIGAVINYKTDKYDDVKLVLDTMMSEEASLIARYGEEGVDWEYAKEWDVGIYGEKATIVTKNYIWNTRQNKHLCGIGPMNVPDKYLIGVTWNGVNSDTEYIDARAKMRYESGFPKETSDNGIITEINNYVDEMTDKFVKGDADINDDKNWQDFCNGYNDIADKYIYKRMQNK